MSMKLDPAATRVFLAKGLADLKMKKPAMRLADRMGALLVTLVGKEYFRYKLLEPAILPKIRTEGLWNPKMSLRRLAILDLTT